MVSTRMMVEDGNITSFVITGFGPFGEHVRENPTTRLVQRLKDYCHSNQISVMLSRSCEDDGADGCHPRGVAAGDRHHGHMLSLASQISNVIVFETSAQAVRDQIDALFMQLYANDHHHQEVSTDTAETTFNTTTTTTTTMAAAINGPQQQQQSVDSIILLHLGVAVMSRCFHIEQFAYNDATFRIPDERGYRPVQECFLPQDRYRYGCALTTPFNIPDCLEQLKTCVWDHPSLNRGVTTTIVEKSMDPGRFVCNYLYCYSLSKFCSIHREGCDSSHMVVESEHNHTLNNVPTKAASLESTTTTSNTTKNDDCTLRSSTEQQQQLLRVYPLFVHVPPFSVFPEEAQLEFITKLMKCLLKSKLPSANTNVFVHHY